MLAPPGECHRAGKKRQNIVDAARRPTGRGEPIGRRGGVRYRFLANSTPGRSLKLRAAFRPKLKAFSLQSYSDKPWGWSAIITFSTRDAVVYASPEAFDQLRCSKTSARFRYTKTFIVVIWEKHLVFCDMFALV
ncbi:hypothetical protein ACJJTC_015860 [Scirpophaga incertulas]